VAGAVLVFGVWALARELAPDDDPAAFVSMAIGLTTLSLLVPLSFLVFFTTLFLLRTVNRTVGLPARITDSAAVTLLVITVIVLTRNPPYGLVAALAFGLDASLQNPLRRQWIFAVLCLAASGVSLVLLEIELSAPSFVNPGVAVLLALVALAFLAMLLQTRVVTSSGDVTGVHLVVGRVRGGMLIAMLVAFQSLFMGETGLAHTSIVWAAMAGVSGMALVTRLVRKFSS
jgi:hypothetical protein